MVERFLKKGYRNRKEIEKLDLTETKSLFLKRPHKENEQASHKTRSKYLQNIHMPKVQYAG